MKNKLQNFLKKLLLKQEYVGVKNKSLANKVIILTGDTGEIGSKIKEVLTRNGATVIGASNNSSEQRVDITDEKTVKDFVTSVHKRYGRIDSVINNAGLFSYGSVENITEAEFDNVVDVNIKGVFLLSKHVTQIMKKQKSGTIINIGSKISKNTMVEPKKSLYALTKYAVEGFSFALNRELRQHGVRVVCLMPGTVNTFFSRKYKDFMSPYDVAELVLTILNLEHIDFESIVFKSLKQNI